MTVYRETPKCPHCDKVIAKGIYKKQNPYNPIYGDTFLRWEYEPHECEKGKLFKAELRQKYRLGKFN